MLLALDYLLDTPKEIVIATPRSREDAAPFLAELQTRFLPNRILTVVGSADVARLVPLVGGKTAIGGRVTAYVCENHVCELPTGDPAVFARQIARVHPLSPSE
jgi:uncharacterized protein YyaL (SSP411 family)